ncbi:MAG TPA: single-stranded-DNA-specific exonuclease RecJ [Acidiferrobacter sp.]|nr:single-stranded-DNA-specific exonuclease RecJ [Acidiferrobacter sp.]
MTPNLMLRPTLCPTLLRSSDWPPLLARVYAARVHDAHDLDLTWDALFSVASLTDLFKASARLARAIAYGEPIVVAGDYDADGATATAVLIRALRQFGACVDFIVPDRRLERYGLTEALAARIGAMVPKPQWVVTVDNGIVSHAGATVLRDIGISLIITDHHLPGDTLPSAYAIINPRRPDDVSGAVNLAGVGVAFLLAIAVRERLLEQKWPAARPSLAPLLPLVALGTIADCVPLDRINRLLVAQGLKVIKNHSGPPGIRALATAARRDVSLLTSDDLAFAVAPRLNAAGRLQDMTLGIQALLTDDDETATRLASHLDGINQERRQLEDTMRQEAEVLVNRDLALALNDIPPVFCLHDPLWHEGVVGLVAARIREQTGRPTVAFAVGADGLLKGSARSIPGIHIRDMIAAVVACHPGLVVRFGGHAQAAGLTLAPDDFPLFTRVLREVVTQSTTAETFCDAIFTDGLLASHEQTVEVAHVLENGGPWGQGFPAPRFIGDFQVVAIRPLSDGLHAKLTVVGEHGAPLAAIAFQCAARLRWTPKVGPARFVYGLTVNRYQGRESVQLLIERVLSEGA